MRRRASPQIRTATNMLDSSEKTLNEQNETHSAPGNSPRKVLVLFGTRPEAIKLAPVIHRLKSSSFQTIVVSSSQHADLLAPFLEIFSIIVDYDLRVMTENQTPTEVCARVLTAFEAILEREKPDIVLVQGDTITAFAGAFAAFNRRIDVGHVEAGLRSGNARSPFPEELNRRLISQIATFHFCATTGNKRSLLGENIPEKQIFVCGNTVVDALNFVLRNKRLGSGVKKLLDETSHLKRILLTTHRRESLGIKITENLKVLRDFVEKREDVCLLFPVHPNPNVRGVTYRILSNRERIFLLEPQDYADFIALMKSAWLIVSDSGGVQEEAPSLGKPLIVVRENTERAEAMEAGIARLAGENLADLLSEIYADESWINSVKEIKNPFGDGKAARRIVEILVKTSVREPGSQTNAEIFFNPK